MIQIKTTAVRAWIMGRIDRPKHVARTFDGLPTWWRSHDTGPEVDEMVKMLAPMIVDTAPKAVERSRVFIDSLARKWLPVLLDGARYGGEGLSPATLADMLRELPPFENDSEVPMPSFERNSGSEEVRKTLFRATGLPAMFGTMLCGRKGLSSSVLAVARGAAGSVIDPVATAKLAAPALIECWFDAASMSAH